MNLKIESTCGPEATTGTLRVGALVLCTLELPWRDNRHGESCVPAGEYLLVPYLSPKHGRTWRLHAPELGVWGQGMLVPEGMRSEIEIHPANWARQLLGCIAVGLSGMPMLDPETHRVEQAVQDSGAAFERLRELLEPPQPPLLTIVRTGDYVTQREG